MTPLIFVTSRVDKTADREETRDAIDQRLVEFVKLAGGAPVVIPNNSLVALDLAARLNPQGLLLSGGNDIGQCPERDETERRLLRHFADSKKPVFGICRGLQFMLVESGAELVPVKNHVRTRHLIHGLNGRSLREVNSYHNYGCMKAPKGWTLLAHTQDGCMEWAEGPNGCQGIMWHPERENPFVEQDIELVRRHFRI